MPDAPQFGQVHVAGATGCGFGDPHSGQNLLVIPAVPQFGQVQVPSGAVGTGLGDPHSGQNLLVIFVAPQEQFHPAAGA